MRLGLREANQGFSKAIRAVRAGKEVVLTDRGRPIAVISPLRAVGSGGGGAGPTWTPVYDVAIPLQFSGVFPPTVLQMAKGGEDGGLLTY